MDRRNVQDKASDSLNYMETQFYQGNKLVYIFNKQTNKQTNTAFPFLHGAGKYLFLAACKDSHERPVICQIFQPLGKIDSVCSKAR